MIIIPLYRRVDRPFCFYSIFFPLGGVLVPPFLLYFSLLHWLMSRRSVWKIACNLYPFNDDLVTGRVHLSNVTGIRSKGQIASFSPDKRCVILNEPIDTMRDCSLCIGSAGPVFKTVRFRACKFIRFVIRVVIVSKSWHISRDIPTNKKRRILFFNASLLVKR